MPRDCCALRTTDHCEPSLSHRGGRWQCASHVVKEVKKVLESGDLVLAACCLSPGEAAPPLVWRAGHALLHPCHLCLLCLRGT